MEDNLMEMNEMNNVEVGETSDLIPTEDSFYDGGDVVESGSGSIVSTLKGAGIGIAVAGAIYGIYRGGKAIKKLVGGKLEQKEIKKLEKRGYTVIPLNQEGDILDGEFEEIDEQSQEVQEEIQEEKKEAPKKKK